MDRRNLGDQIKDIVEDAIGSSNYQDLNNKIRYTADRAMDEFNRATNAFIPRGGNRNRWDDVPPFDGQGREYGHGPGGTGGQGGQPFGHQPYRTTNSWGFTGNDRGQAGRNRQRGQNYGNTGNAPYGVSKSQNRVKGSISSIVYMVLGMFGTVGFGIAAIVLACVLVGTGFFNPVLKILVTVFGCAALASLPMFVVGVRKKKMIDRFRIYQSLLQKNKFCEVKRLAEYIGKSNRFVIRDLRKMMLLSFFPEGHFDDKKTCFIQDDETYSQYLAAEKSYQERSKMEESTKAEQKVAEHEEKVSEELAKAIADGKAYIKAIREANDDIPGEEISRKLERLENIIQKIFICVEKHPEKLPEIRKFMEYYLPITIKLVNAYKEFDSQPIQGENITNSKNEIEATLDTIDLAFEKLLDSLYEEEAMEVSSDISVLNALFAQEGLTKKDFDIK